MNRRTAREKAMQILFQFDINETDPSQAIENFLGSDKGNEYLTTLVEGVQKNNTKIDSIIKEHLENWTMDRIAFIEKTILRLATYEMFFLEDIPTGVSINEAVELAKKYGDEKSGKFVNGVLSKVIM